MTTTCVCIDKQNTIIQEIPNPTVLIAEQTLETITILDNCIPSCPGKTISETPPVNPMPGKEWLNSTTGKNYTWYDDSTSSQWIED